MREHDFDRAFANTPPAFHDRVEQTLLRLKEEPMKQFTLRTAALTAAILLALGGIAYAAIHFGQEWYYNTRFTAYQEHEPEKHQAIMENMQSDIEQEFTGPAAELINMRVLDASWVDDRGLLIISTLATPVDDKAHELHSLWEMDVDGANVGEIDPDDEESRLHHWLWTTKGHGLPEDVMIDPSKKLLLVDTNTRLLIGETDTAFPDQSFDQFTTEEGPVMTVTEYDYKTLGIVLHAPQATAQVTAGDNAQTATPTPEPVLPAHHIFAGVAQAVTANTDEQGMLRLRYQITVQSFENDTFGEKVNGELRFKLKVPTE